MLPGRVRRARLHHRLGLEGLPGDRRGLRDRAARRACASPSGCPSRSSRPPPRPRWATTTRTSTSTAPPRSSATAALLEELRRLSLALYALARRARARARDHPRRHQVRVRPPRRRRDRARRRGADARLVALLAGRRLRAGPRASRASTSSTCATGPPARAGTRRRPRRECPTTSSSGTRARYVEAYERITGEPLRALARAARSAHEGARPDPAEGGDPRPAGPGGRARAARARLRGRAQRARRPPGRARRRGPGAACARCASGCSPTR